MYALVSKSLMTFAWYYSELGKTTGTRKIYQSLSNWVAQWNNDFVEPFRDTLYRRRTIVNWKSAFYFVIVFQTNTQKDGTLMPTTLPVLVVYACLLSVWTKAMKEQIKIEYIKKYLSKDLSINYLTWKLVCICCIYV